MVRLMILTMPGCERCGEVKSTIEKVKNDYPGLMVEEFDITEHPDLAQKYMVMISPGIVINDKLEFSGPVKEKDLRERLDKAFKEVR